MLLFANGLFLNSKIRVRENRLSLIKKVGYNESWILLFLNPCAWLSLKRNNT